MKKTWFALIICIAVGVAIGVGIRPLPVGAQANNSSVTISGTPDPIRVETLNNVVRISDSTFVVAGRGGSSVYRLEGDSVKRIGVVPAP